ncbi:MAG: hypothetical protein HY360_01165 [Verrucomicrobia bacterium]|nr:hypothetical protein [Verrucomicrobiota bacterium]
MIRSAHYISGTHWDREWYRPFQEFRFLLVKLPDELLDLMERNRLFRFFQPMARRAFLSPPQDGLAVASHGGTRNPDEFRGTI